MENLRDKIFQVARTIIVIKTVYVTQSTLNIAHQLLAIKQFKMCQIVIKHSQ